MLQRHVAVQWPLKRQLRFGEGSGCDLLQRHVAVQWPLKHAEAYPTPGEWALIVGLALVPAAIVELSKVVRKRADAA